MPLKKLKAEAGADIGFKAPASQGAAAATVLGLPELLEQVLIHLDFRTLFKLRRVNQAFHAAMNSKAVQRKMCLVEDPDIDLGAPIETIANPLLLDDRIGFKTLQFSFRDPQQNNSEHREHLVTTGQFWSFYRLHLSRSSWRETKLVKGSCGIRHVLLRVNHDACYEPRRARHFDLQEGATLGDLVDGIFMTLKQGLEAVRGMVVTSSEGWKVLR